MARCVNVVVDSKLNAANMASAAFGVATILMAMPDSTYDVTSVYEKDDDNLLVGFGGEFDTRKKDKVTYRNPKVNGYPYSIAGLVWKKYGDLIVSPSQQNFIDNQLFKKLDSAVVLPYIKDGLLSAMTAMCPTWDQSSDNIAWFDRMVNVATDILSGYINQAEANVTASRLVKDAISDGKVTDDILELDEFIPFNPFFGLNRKEYENMIRWVLYPTGDKYNLCAIKYNNRMKFDRSVIGGKTDLKGCEFINHNTCTAVFNNRTDAIAAAAEIKIFIPADKENNSDSSDDATEE